MAYDVSIGVRHGNLELRAQIESLLVKEKRAIDALLRAYNVPRTTAQP
jgi:hypothetical protein